MVIVFFGPPGSGKGTQAKALEQTVPNMLHVSTGDLLRQEITSASDLGIEIQQKVQAGEFPKDDTIIRLVEKILAKNAEKSIIFDGFPRTLQQAIALDTLLGVLKLQVDVVFDFDIDVNVLVERVSGRYMCSSCGAVYHDKSKKPQVDNICDKCGSSKFERRSDDTADTLKTRLQVYREQTLPVKDYYQEKGVLKRIDASLAQAQVTNYINKALLEAGLMNKGE